MPIAGGIPAAQREVFVDDGLLQSAVAGDHAGAGSGDADFAARWRGVDGLLHRRVDRRGAFTNDGGAAGGQLIRAQFRAVALEAVFAVHIAAGGDSAGQSLADRIRPGQQMIAVEVEPGCAGDIDERTDAARPDQVGAIAVPKRGIKRHRRIGVGLDADGVTGDDGVAHHDRGGYAVLRRGDQPAPIARQRGMDQDGRRPRGIDAAAVRSLVIGDDVAGIAARRARSQVETAAQVRGLVAGDDVAGKRGGSAGFQVNAAAVSRRLVAGDRGPVERRRAAEEKNAAAVVVGDVVADDHPVQQRGGLRCAGRGSVQIDAAAVAALVALYCVPAECGAVLVQIQTAPGERRDIGVEEVAGQRGDAAGCVQTAAASLSGAVGADRVGLDVGVRAIEVEAAAVAVRSVADDRVGMDGAVATARDIKTAAIYGAVAGDRVEADGRGGRVQIQSAACLEQRAVARGGLVGADGVGLEHRVGRARHIQPAAAMADVLAHGIACEGGRASRQIDAAAIRRARVDGLVSGDGVGGERGRAAQGVDAAAQRRGRAIGGRCLPGVVGGDGVALERGRAVEQPQPAAARRQVATDSIGEHGRRPRRNEDAAAVERRSVSIRADGVLTKHRGATGQIDARAGNRDVGLDRHAGQRGLAAYDKDAAAARRLVVAQHQPVQRSSGLVQIQPRSGRGETLFDGDAAQDWRRAVHVDRAAVAA